MPKVVWSHSSLKDFEGCARRYHEIKVLKNYKFEETEATRYGTDLHKAAEDYLADGVVLPSRFTFVKDVLDVLYKKPGRKLTEHKMALTEKLRTCEWDASDVWVRGIADLLIIDDENLTAWVVDYKTGNNRYPDREQLVLMSLLVFAHFPHIRQVKSALLFVVKNDMVKHNMSVDETKDEWQRYRERSARISACIDSGVWNPKQTPLCGWCAVKSCEFNPKH
jgi:RecB family exonuclease